MPKIGFTPISIEAFVTEFMKSNPGENPASVTASLKGALAAYKRGVTCSCGAPIWVIGSAVSGNACFTCITGEAVPDSDYEIDAACG